jgi:hypothetical protein
LRSRTVRSENGNTRRAQFIGQTVRERILGPDHDQRDGVRGARGNHVGGRGAELRQISNLGGRRAR